MTKRDFFWVVTVLLGFLLQITLSDYISISRVYPNFLLVATVFFAVRRGPVTGQLVGFTWGLISDAASVSIFGSQSFMMTLVGFAAGSLRGKIDEEQVSAQMGLVLVLSYVILLGLIAFEALFDGAIAKFHVKTSYLQPLYSAAVCPPLFWILSRWTSLFYGSSKRELY